jgi:Co/Zn/Cd efflux system component
MDACCDVDREFLDQSQRKTLWLVLAINSAMFIAVLAAAVIANSSSLLSGTIDNLGDAFTYALSLHAVSNGRRHKARVSLIKGFLILFAALSVFAHVVFKLSHPEAPAAGLMGIMTLISLGANAACLALLWKHREEDINMASVWECSRNDVMENLAILVAAIGVWVLASQWPDMVVAVILTAMLFRSALRIIRSSLGELKKPR